MLFIFPKSALVTFKLVKPRKFVWLNTLYISARSCSFTVSLKRTDFDIVKSTRFVDGPLIMPRPAFPTVFGKPVAVFDGLVWKHAVLKYCRTVCGALAFGSQRTFGLAAGFALINPRPAKSRFEVTAVNGRPLL